MGCRARARARVIALGISRAAARAAAPQLVVAAMAPGRVAVVVLDNDWERPTSPISAILCQVLLKDWWHLLLAVVWRHLHGRRALRLLSTVWCHLHGRRALWLLSTIWWHELGWSLLRHLSIRWLLSVGKDLRRLSFNGDLLVRSLVD